MLEKIFLGQKKHEEDIVIINEITNTKFLVSLKAYGDGPLQLSTDSRQKYSHTLKIKDYKLKILNK